MQQRTLLFSLVVLTLLGTACEDDPYYPNVTAEISGDLDPSFENGNLGSGHVEERILELTALEDSEDGLSEEEATELEALRDAHLITIAGSFEDCDSPVVVFGSRGATVVQAPPDPLVVLAPAGPVSGGPVDVRVSCPGGLFVKEDGYDYALAPIVTREVEDGLDGEFELVGPDANARMEPLFANEYASFGLFYQAEPFINWPEPIGYGFFFNGEGPRGSAYYAGNPGMVYGGRTYDNSDYLPVPALSPPVDFAAPDQGDRIRGGSSVSFFRPRANSDLTEPLTATARKRPIANPFASDQDQPDPHTQQNANNTGVWMVVPFETDGDTERRYIRVSQLIGQWCGGEVLRDGCNGGAGDQVINDLRLPLDFRWKWLEPDEPDASDLAPYPHASPEHIAYLDCVNGGGSADSCEADSGVDLPTGTYEDVVFCKSFDEFDDFPWETDGFCVPLETLDSIRIEEGAQYVDLESNILGHWTLDEENNVYDGFETIGENVMPVGGPIWVSYEGGFYRGNLIPAKNHDPGRDEGLRIAKDMDSNAPGIQPPLPGSSDYDAYPYIEIPSISISTFLGANSPFNGVDENGDPLLENSDERPYLGYPALLPYPATFDWHFSLPGGYTSSTSIRDNDMRSGVADPRSSPEDDSNCVREAESCSDLEDNDNDGFTDAEDPDCLDSRIRSEIFKPDADCAWPDTYFVVSLEVRDLDMVAGLDETTVWQSTAWAWAGDDYITIPVEALATLPEVADVFRPDAEDQAGSSLLGMVTIEIHRAASWELSSNDTDFEVAPEGRAVFDVNTITMGYFHNQHSCFDAQDNDQDGFCDFDGCEGPDGNRLPPDPACIPLNPGDDQPEYETAVCQDGEDNDGDGLIDLEDPDCEDGNDVLEDFTCGDGIDNDGDGWTDFPLDPGCESATGHSEGGFSYLTDCNDSIDDDGDGRIDADDPGCLEGAGESESEGDTCGNGEDDNEDGWVDADDFTCRPGSGFEGEDFYSNGDVEAAQETDGVYYECSDSDALGATDNDLDGAANNQDEDCLWGWDPSGESGVPNVCSDRLDNDGDGWVDAEDPQCSINPDDEVEGLPGGTCNNGEDDDEDGWADADDPDCLTGEDDEVLLGTPLQCNNGEDDDGDGLKDSQDPDCQSGKDNHEEP